MALNFILGGVAVYGLVVGGLYLMQESMIFPRHNTQAPKYPLPPESERLRLTTKDGHTIVGNLVRARGNSRGLVFAFAGNAWNSDDCTVWVSDRLVDVDIAVFHYRGYEPSEGEPSEAALFSDALLIYDTLTTGMKPEKVYSIGFSLGSGVSSYLSKHRKIDGQILFTPFDSIASIATRRYKILPVSKLLKHPFHSVEHLRALRVPTAVITAETDRVVPKYHSDHLIDGLAWPVMVETIPGTTHGGIYDDEATTEVFHKAFDRIEQAALKQETVN